MIGARGCWCTAARSIAPRSHVGVLSSFAQPAVNLCVPLRVGVASSAIVAFSTAPPVIQAATLPRLVLCCSGSTPAHRLAVIAAVRMMRSAEAAPADADAVGVAVLSAGAGVGVAEVGDGAGSLPSPRSGWASAWWARRAESARCARAGVGVVSVAVGDGDLVPFRGRVGVVAGT